MIFNKRGSHMSAGAHASPKQVMPRNPGRLKKMVMASIVVSSLMVVLFFSDGAVAEQKTSDIGHTLEKAEMRAKITLAPSTPKVPIDAPPRTPTKTASSSSTKPAPKSAPKAPKSITPASGEHGGTWSRAKLAGVLAAACDYYDIKGSDKDWLVAKGVHISADGECRSGQTWRKNPSSSALGLYQFLQGWNKAGYGCRHGASDWRACGTCSVYRFVKVYKVQGASGLKKHWAATYY